MRTRPGRLYRTLQRLGIPTPLLTVTASGHGLIRDDQIRSVVTHHGTQGPSEGLHPSTCEISTTLLTSILTGNNIKVELSEPAALRLLALTGASPTLTLARFSGRIGVQDVEDTGRRQMVTLVSSSWSAQLSNSRTVYSAAKGAKLSGVLVGMMTPPHLAPLLTVTAADTGDYLFEAAEGRFSDLFDKHASDIGISALHWRTGRVQLVARAGRKAAAAAAAGQYPLTRSQVLAPSSWSQPSEIVADNMVAIYTNGVGQPVRVTANLGSPLSSPERVLDWQHIQFYSEQWRHIDTLEHRQSPNRYQLPSVTIDLLALLDSGTPYNLRQVGQLLSLNQGDPILLSGDWHPDIEGVNFVTGIDETLNKETWEMTLSLSPYLHVVGEQSPGVQPRIWDSARRAWDTETRRWSETA